MAGENEITCSTIHAKHGEVVAALIAHIKKLAGGIKIETARIISARPFFPDVGQFAVPADGENPDAVMQAIAGINELAIGRDEYFGAEITAGKTGRQAGDGLARGQPALGGLEVEENHGRAFFLNGVEPAPIRMEVEMPRAIAGRQRDPRWIVRREHAFLVIKLPNEDLIQAEIDVQHEASRRIGLDHVRVSPVVSAEGKTSGRCVRGFFRSERSRIRLVVRGGPETAIGKNRQHRHGAAEVVRHQQNFPDGWTLT